MTVVVLFDCALSLRRGAAAKKKMGSMIPHLNGQCNVQLVDLAGQAETLRGMMNLLRGYLLNHKPEENALVPPWIVDGTVVVSSGRVRYSGHARYPEARVLTRRPVHRQVALLLPTPTWIPLLPERGHCEPGLPAHGLRTACLGHPRELV